MSTFILGTPWEKIWRKSKKVLTTEDKRGNINLALNDSATEYARVVELADSLDSGSSVHYARAGSSPASRTTSEQAIEACSDFFSFKGQPREIPAAVLIHTIYTFFSKYRQGGGANSLRFPAAPGPGIFRSMTTLPPLAITLCPALCSPASPRRPLEPRRRRC